MAVDKWTLVGIPATTPIEQATAEDYVITGTSEFSHEIENELRETIKGNRKDWSGGVVEETISVTFPYDPAFKSDTDFKEACKNGRQMRFWIIDNALVGTGETAVHNSTFAYVIPESHSLSVDDESDEIEVSLKVKLNSAVGEEPKLPDEILDPSLAAQIAYETIGQETGNLESVASQNV
jgi:hypothetical protein